jgi:outer membrane protein assembly factor BamB
MAGEMKRFVVGWALIGIFGCAAMAPWRASAAGTDPMDWPNWRGPQQNRISTEKGLVDHWDPKGGPGSNVLWTSEALAGRSSPITLRGKLYTIVRDKPGTADEGEKVICADAATGKPIWEHRSNVSLTEVPPERVGWSNVVADPETGRVYYQGVSGYFCCLEGDSGKVVWDRNLAEQFGTISTFGGRTNTPVVFEDTVLISAVLVDWGDADKWGGFAKPAHRFMCFDKATGELRWINGTSISPYDTNYGTPTLAVLNGQQALVFESGDGGVWALQPRTGQPIWHLIFSRAGANISPLVTADGKVYVGHAKENTVGTSMGTVAALDGTMTGDLKGKELWRKDGVMAGLSSPLLIGDRLYQLDDGAKLYIFDAKTGDEIARKALGTFIFGTPLYADGKFYLCTNSSQSYILKPSDDGVKVVQKIRLDEDAKECNGSPMVSHGRLYIPTGKYMYCVGEEGKKPEADPLPKMPEESAASQDQAPALAQVVPFDVILRPGDKQAYKVRVFNKRGQLLSTAAAKDVKFAVDGPGTIDADGTYHAPADKEHQCALVTCQIGDLKGSARVRVVPPLPWKWDFNAEKDVPLTWVGGRVRYMLKDLDGEKILAKKDLLPTPRDPKNKLGTRSTLFMGQSDLANYTIQGDVMLNGTVFELPDVGLVNSGYEMILRSRDKKLRAESWTSHDVRSSSVVPFEPKPSQWYTLKLKVVPEKDIAHVMGKIWERGQPEPDKWTVDFVDHSPNLHGSPGLFGKSEDAEIYLDNISVTPN